MNLGQYLGELLLRVEGPAVTAVPMAKLPNLETRAESVRRLSPVRIKILKYMARRSDAARLHDVAVHLRRPTTHVSGFLTTLVRDGLLEREGAAKGYVYQLTPAGRAAVTS